MDVVAGAGWVGDAAEELTAVARACRAVAGVRAPVDVRACPGGAEGPCTGVLRLDGPDTLACPVCARSWPRTAWTELADDDVLLSTSFREDLNPGVESGAMTIRYGRTLGRGYLPRVVDYLVLTVAVGVVVSVTRRMDFRAAGAAMAARMVTRMPIAPCSA